MADTPILDDDGYPHECDLERIESWHVGDGPLFSLLDFIGRRWSYPDRWIKDDHVDGMGHEVWRCRCSTGGWSGNEDLIGALRENFFAWSLAWYQSRRGGHHEFWVRKDGGL